MKIGEKIKVKVYYITSSRGEYDYASPVIREYSTNIIHTCRPIEIINREYIRELSSLCNDPDDQLGSSEFFGPPMWNEGAKIGGFVVGEEAMVAVIREDSEYWDTPPENIPCLRGILNCVKAHLLAQILSEKCLQMNEPMPLSAALMKSMNGIVRIKQAYKYEQLVEILQECFGESADSAKQMVQSARNMFGE